MIAIRVGYTRMSANSVHSGSGCLIQNISYNTYDIIMPITTLYILDLFIKFKLLQIGQI